MRNAYNREDTKNHCVHCERQITLDTRWARQKGSLGIWYHDDLLDYDSSGYSCGLDDGEDNEAEPYSTSRPTMSQRGRNNQ